ATAVDSAAGERSRTRERGPCAGHWHAGTAAGAGADAFTRARPAYRRRSCRARSRARQDQRDRDRLADRRGTPLSDDNVAPAAGPALTLPVLDLVSPWLAAVE